LSIIYIIHASDAVTQHYYYQEDIARHCSRQQKTLQ
jgi:hypothetical protein